jgi:hypothetical protein
VSKLSYSVKIYEASFSVIFLLMPSELVLFCDENIKIAAIKKIPNSRNISAVIIFVLFN